MVNRVAVLVLLVGLAFLGACRSPGTCISTAPVPSRLEPGVFEYRYPGGDPRSSTPGRALLVLSRDCSFHLIGLGAYLSDLVPFGGQFRVSAREGITFTPSYTAWDRPAEYGSYRRALDLSAVPLLPTGRAARRFVGARDGTDKIEWPDYLMGHGPVVFRRLSGSPAPWLARLVQRGMGDAQIGSPSLQLAGTYRLDRASLKATDVSAELDLELTLRGEGTFSGHRRVGDGQPDPTSGEWYRSGRYLLFRLLTKEGRAVRQSPASIITAELVNGRIRIKLTHYDPAVLPVPVLLVRDPAGTSGAPPER